MESEQQTLACYRKGLRSKMCKEILIARLLNVEEAYQLALQVEKQVGLSTRKRVKLMAFLKPLLSNDQARSVVARGLKGKARLTAKGLKCYKCKGFGHHTMIYPTMDNKLTFFCAKELKVLDLLKDGEEEEANDDVEHLGATYLPSCVIHRVLIDTKKELQGYLTWQGTNIFHTHMEHGGLALNVIIDNGQGMNVMSRDVVERLDLKVDKHPTLSRVGWINEDNPILVKFSLEKKYMDEARCDMVPMTVYHLLLRRPWLYDRRVLYDRYANSYSFKFKDKKFILDPMHISEFEAPLK